MFKDKGMVFDKTLTEVLFFVVVMWMFVKFVFHGTLDIYVRLGFLRVKENNVDVYILKIH